MSFSIQSPLQAQGVRDAEAVSAATTIQKHLRGHFTRKATLPSHLFPRYLHECSKALGLGSNSMKRAEAGTTRVYLPEGGMSGFVLKLSYRRTAITRFHQMQEVRSILRNFNTSDLIIPKAFLCGEFLVEERLPINVNYYHNMEIYLKNTSLFNNAIVELTKLFSKGYLDDLIGANLWNSLSNIDGVYNSIRYDNLPLYIVEKNGKSVGKIGLIDLEHMQKKPNPAGLQTLARIFPYHLDIIIEEANSLGIINPIDLIIDKRSGENPLVAAANKGKKYLQVGFSDHISFLKQKGISSENAHLPFKIGVEEIEKLYPLVKNELVKIDQNGVNPEYIGLSDKQPSEAHFEKGFLQQSTEVTAKKLAREIVPLVIDHLTTLINTHQSEKLSHLSVNAMSDSQLVDLRSLDIGWRKFFIKGLDKLISDNSKIQLSESQNIRKPESGNIAKQITHFILEKLVEAGEIHLFAPSKSPRTAVYWVRF
jgi:hypothetical protein